MQSFHGVPVYWSNSSGRAAEHVLTLDTPEIRLEKITAAIERDRLVLLRATPFARAVQLFGELADHYGLRDSYDLQICRCSMSCT